MRAASIERRGKFRQPGCLVRDWRRKFCGEGELVRIGVEEMLRATARPCRIEASLHTRPQNAGPSWRRSYLKSEWLPLSHIEHCYKGQFDRRDVPAERAADYNTCLHWPGGFPAGSRELVEVLSDCLVLPTDDHRIELAMALDWYKVIDADVPSTQWDNTVPGQLVYKAKYWVSNPPVRRAAAEQLIEMLSTAIARHPAYRASKYIVSVPGSNGDGTSVGEYIATHVAEQTGKLLAKTTGPAREPRKGGGATSSLDGQFALPTLLDGTCLVIDDVYKSGMTMRATALAARQAGASAVYGLVAAKTVSG